MMGYDMGKCFHNRKHPVIAPWIRMVALTAAWVVLWANLGMVTSMGAQAGAGNLVEARAGSQADAWAGTQADTGQRLFDEAGLLSGEEQGSFGHRSMRKMWRGAGLRQSSFTG